MNPRCFLPIVALAMASALPAAAASFDCQRAASPVEKFICSHPEISRLDEQMTDAYQRLQQDYPALVRSAVLPSQREWLSYWPRTCSSNAATIQLGKNEVSCAKEQYRKRITDLQPRKLPDGTQILTRSRFAAAFDKKSGDSALGKHELRYPEVILTTAPPSKRAAYEALNRLMHVDEATWKSPSDTEAWDAVAAVDANADSEFNRSIELVAPSLITITSGTYSYGHGAAHPLTFGERSHFRLDTAQALRTSDWFKGTAWKTLLGNLAYSFVRKEYGQSNDFGDASALALEPERWNFEKNGLSITFNQYEVAPYSAGTPSFTVPWRDLKSHLTPYALEQIAQMR